MIVLVAADLLPTKVESPPPLIMNTLHILFKMRIPNVGLILIGLQLEVREAWIALVLDVIELLNNIERWALLFSTCILNTFQSTHPIERREATCTVVRFS